MSARACRWHVCAPTCCDLDANRAHLERWMPWVEHEHEAADVLPFIRATRRQIADNDGLQTAILAPDGRIVGMVGFHSIDWMNRSELSQAIPPAYTAHVGAALLGHLAYEGVAHRVLGRRA